MALDLGVLRQDPQIDAVHRGVRPGRPGVRPNIDTRARGIPVLAGRTGMPQDGHRLGYAADECRETEIALPGFSAASNCRRQDDQEPLGDRECRMRCACLSHAADGRVNCLKIGTWLAQEASARADAPRCCKSGGRLEREASPLSRLGERRYARMSASTSSRFSSISASERASRFSRRSGSVFDGRTLKCQSGASTERPSRCETFPSEP